MILIRRLAAPPKLIEQQSKWTARWKNGRPKEWATKTAKRILQHYVRLKSHNKCVYCESVLGGAARAEIEHYQAKTVEPDLAFEWSNLFFACGFCNSTKLNEAHGGALLKPDVDDGEAHFWMNRDTGELELLSGENVALAQTTIRLCDLNRETLCRERLDRYRLALAFFEALEAGAALTAKSRVAFVEFFLFPSAQYKLAIRSALPKRLAEVDRRMYHAAD